MTLKRVSSIDQLLHRARQTRITDEQTAKLLTETVITPLTQLPFVEDLYLDTDEDFLMIQVVADQLDEAQMVQIWDIEQDAMEIYPELKFSIELIERFGRGLHNLQAISGQHLYHEPD